jgi:hypothetical protein
MARALTDRQLAVHAALERLGSPTLPELVDELQRFGPAQLGLPIVQHPDGTVETRSSVERAARRDPAALEREHVGEGVEDGVVVQSPEAGRGGGRRDDRVGNRDSVAGLDDCRDRMRPRSRRPRGPRTMRA